MRIAHLCEKAFNGGALASLKQIRLGLSIVKKDWEQKVIVASKKDVNSVENPDFFEQDACYVHYENLNKFLHQFDVVIIHKLMNTNVGRILSYVPRGACRTVVVSHTYSVSPSNCLVGRPDLCICVSNYMKKNFQKINPKTNITAIHNAVSSNWIKNKVKSTSTVREGVVGRSNTLNLIKYSSKFTDWFCSTDFGKPLIMEYLGGGSLINEARAHAEIKSKINSIDFKGNVESEEVRFDLMSSWELFLYDINLPEGTSMSVLESLALGVPVICSDKPGNNEIIHPGSNGYLFRDLNQAASIVKDLFENGKIYQLRNNCRQLSENDDSFLRMSRSYAEAIESINIKKIKKDIVSNMSSSNGSAQPELNMAKNKNDFIIRGNRKVAFKQPIVPKAADVKKKIEEEKLKSKENDLNRIKHSDVESKKIKEKKNQDSVKNKNNAMIKTAPKVKSKDGHKPVASESFISDVFSRIEKADKVFEGPKFTIISAAYDKGRYLDDWMKSILEQTYRPLEVVFVDDNSSDNTDENIKSMYEDFSRNGIELVHIKNEVKKGCAKSYGIALNAGTGDYFGVLDADDALLPNAVSVVMARYLSNEKISFIWSQYVRCNHDMSMVGSGISRQVPQRPAKSILDFESHTRRVHCYSHWRTMKRLPDMKDVFDCPYTSSVDKFMGYMLEELGHGHFLNIPLYKYRGSVSDGLTATSAQRNNWDKIRNDAKKRRMRSRKKIYSVII